MDIPMLEEMLPSLDKGPSTRQAPVNQRLSSRRKKNEPQNVMFRDFGIDNENNPKLRMADYKIIEIIESSSESQTADDFIGKDHNYWTENPINKVRIKEICSFKGPTFVSFNNFGLYAGEDLEIFAFYYRDLYKNL